MLHASLALRAGVEKFMLSLRESTTMSRFSTGFFAAVLAGAGWLGHRAPGPDGKDVGPAGAPDGWATAAPREEVRPAFAYEPAGGPGGKGAFVIRHDRRDGLDGCWTKTFPVAGGKHYR